MNDDDQKKVLEAAARTADRIAADHEPACGTAKLMRSVSRAARDTLAAHKGPAQVATPAFRDNWETLFGKKQSVGQA